MKKQILLLFAFVGMVLQAQAQVFDRSHSIFFPPGLKTKITAYQSFPIFWWDFIVLSATSDPVDWGDIEKFCADVKSFATDFSYRVECGQSLQEVKPLLQDWAKDYPLKHPRPSQEEILTKMDSALAKASLPSGDSGLTDLLRSDPLDSWRELLQLAEKKLKMNLNRTHGFFFDAENRRVVIPVQMKFSPSETHQSRVFFEKVTQAGQKVGQIYWIGPHNSNLQNETQIGIDTHRVTWVGIAVLVGFSAVLFLLKRGKLFFLIPVVLLAIGVATAATILIFGSIHGLTLSFGTGIIGLALDYGLQGALNSKSKYTWKSNLFGLLTTLVGLVVLSLSSVPLLRQMMFFSILGLICGFAAFYLALTRFPKIFIVEPLDISPRPKKFKMASVVFLVLVSIYGLAVLRPNLDMKQFDFQDEGSRKVMMWLFKTLSLRPPLFQVRNSDQAFEGALAEKEWASLSGVTVENVAQYFPPISVQQENLQAWKKAGCDLKGFSEVQQKFFAPFIENQLCPKTEPFSPSGDPSKIPNYVKHLTDSQQWVTLWVPKTDAEEKLVREAYPEATSMKDVISIFPETLSRELKWMVPTSFLLATLLLLVYYRNLKLALLALVPFFSGLGLFTLGTVLFQFQVSFISLIAAIMVFGFSFDYGIFATDVVRRSGRHSVEGVWTGLGFAALATLGGFAPLLFCKHPVLAHLGQGLFFGAVGTYLGAIWGIPSFLGRSGKSAKK